MKQKRKTAVSIGICLVLGALSGSAREVVLRPNTTTTQWRSHVQNDPIQAMHVWVRRASGNSGTYFNMRFGRDGHTFDGRRVYLKDNRTVKASWALNGRRPDGKELIMNSYKGQVHLERIVIVYQSGRKSNYQYDQRSNDRYDDDRYRDDNRYDRNDRDDRYSRGAYYDRTRDRYGRDGRYDQRRSDEYECRPRYSRYSPRR